jgi:hypothetical protein
MLRHRRFASAEENNSAVRCANFTAHGLRLTGNPVVRGQPPVVWWQGFLWGDAPFLTALAEWHCWVDEPKLAAAVERGHTGLCELSHMS